MSSAFDSLITGVVTLLNTATAVCPYVGTEADAEPLPAGRSAAIIVTLGNADPQQMAGIAGNPVDWVTEVHVSCYASATASSARAAANTLANAAYTRLATDPSLGLGVGVFAGEPRIQWSTEQAATRLACANLVYSVSHRTSGGNLN